MRAFDELLRESSNAHGHHCARQVLGVRMAMVGCREVGIDEPKGCKKLIVYAEMDRCATDAVQAVKDAQEALAKARRLQAMAQAAGRRVSIGMDGGLGRGNIRAALLAGVDFAVVGSAIFAAPDPIQEMSALRQAAHSEPA